LTPIALPLVPFIVSLSAALVGTPLVARLFLKKGLWGFDVHKRSKCRVPEMGGVAVLISFLIGTVVVALIQPSLSSDALWFSLSLVMIALVGVVDDVFGLRQRTKLVLTLLAAYPATMLCCIPEGIAVPFVGQVMTGWAFRFAVVPLGIAVTANLANMYAGFNGLEAGIAVVSLTFGVVLTMIAGVSTDLPLFWPLIGALLGFLVYNRYPSKIFPGDTGTLMMGASFGLMAILGGIELYAIVVYLPLIVDFLFKARVSFSTRQRGDSRLGQGNVLIPAPYFCLTHAVMRVAKTEKILVLALWGVSGLFGLIAVALACLFPSIATTGVSDFGPPLWCQAASVVIPLGAILAQIAFHRRHGARAARTVEEEIQP